MVNTKKYKQFIQVYNSYSKGNISILVHKKLRTIFLNYKITKSENNLPTSFHMMFKTICRPFSYDPNETQNK